MTEPGQDGLFDVWCSHAVFLTSEFEMVRAESQHRDHAIIEQVIADAVASALAHLPSECFQANAAWVVLWAIAHNLTRPRHHRHHSYSPDQHPRPLARSARRPTLHMSEHSSIGPGNRPGPTSTLQSTGHADHTQPELITAQSGPDRTTAAEKPGRPAASAHPKCNHPQRRSTITVKRS